MDEPDLNRRSEAPVKLGSAGDSCSGLPCATPQALRSGPNPLPATPLNPLPATPPGRYRHYKGGEYEVIGAARHSETLEPLVVYRPLYDASGLWVRPHTMFFEAVDLGHGPQPRFVFLAA